MAFYPWKFSNLSENSPVVKGIFMTERLNISSEQEEVVANNVDVVVAGDPLVVGNTDTDRAPSTVEYFTMTGNGVGRFAQTNNTHFVDWETADGTGATYSSYVETGFELFNDAMRRKELTYVVTYMRKTEDKFDPASGEFDDPSSCYMTTKWDWADTTKANKWSRAVQIYRPGRFLPMNAPDYDTGFPIVVTRNKVR